MKVAIIGAGVGGLATAVGLRAGGHAVEVYEAGEELRTGGNGLIIWSNGTGILGRLGIPHEGLGRQLDVTEQRTQDGDLIIRTEWTQLSEHVGTPPVLVRRGTVIERLAGQLPPGTIRFGQSCARVDNRARSAVATFTDGSQVEADVIVGADGHRSVIRRQLFGAEPARYTGIAAWHGVTELPTELTGLNQVWVLSGPAGVAALHPIGDGLLFWAFETPWQDGQTLPPGAPDGSIPASDSAVENLKARFGGWGDPVPELLDSIKDEDVSLFPFVMHEVPKKWADGRITLVGDAAHVVPPRTAQGVNQALEDAYVLSRVLTGKRDPAAELLQYGRVRRSKIRALWVTAKLTESKAGLKFLELLFRYAKQDSPKAQKRNSRLYSNYLSDLARSA